MANTNATKKVFSDFVTNIPKICDTIGADIADFKYDDNKISGSIVREAEVMPFEIYSVPGNKEDCQLKIFINNNYYYALGLDVDRAHEILTTFTVNHDVHNALEMMTADELKAEADYDVSDFGKSIAEVITVEKDAATGKIKQFNVYNLSSDSDQYKHM